MKNVLCIILILNCLCSNLLMGIEQPQDSIPVARQASQKLFPENQSATGITLNKSYTEEELINDIFVGGDCFEISNIEFHGNINARGAFSNGTAAIGIESGIVLASGDINNISGPNAGGGTSSCFNSSNGSHSDLQLLDQNNLIRDIAEIEFDFTPTVDFIEFKYVFGSEEYCEYVNSSYNDLFGFFISGPGISGSFSNGAKNIATIPGTSTYVGINSVNHQSASNFFLGNSSTCNNNPAASGEIEYDGFTKVLTASTSVIPCETYHIKIAIADFGDCVWDSGVFLQANSFNLGGNASVYPSSPLNSNGDISEGCTNGSFIFERSSGTDMNQPLEVCFGVGGTATPGLDYNPIGNCITIPAGQNTFELPVEAYFDSVSEGNETIVIALDLPCSCNDPITDMIIADASPMSVAVEDLILCGNENGTLSPIVTDGVQPLQWEWSTGETTTTIIVSPTTSDYILTVTDACGNSTTNSIHVEAVPQPEIILGELTDVSCFQGADGSIIVGVSSGTAPFDYQWSNGEDIEYVEGLVAGTYSVTVTDFYGCQDEATYTVDEPTLLEAEVSIDDVRCFGESNGGIWLDTVYGGTPPYVYFLNGERYTEHYGFFNLPAGDYTLDIVDANDCQIGFDLIINQPPLLTLEIIGDSIIELGCEVELAAIATNPYPTDLFYEWKNFDCENCDEISDQPFFEKWYHVSVMDENGCTAEDKFRVFVEKPRNVFIPNAFSPDGNGVNDIFFINGGKDVIEVLEFQIFDRWGEQVYAANNFQPNDYSFGWDGTFNGKELPSGVYVYSANILFLDDVEIPYKGDVTLVK